MFEKRYNNRINNAYKFYQMFEKRYNNRINTVNKCLEMSKRRGKIIENYNNDLKTSFNIFSDLSIDSKFYEMDHSKILAKILSPDNKIFGDKEYLRIFIRLIEKIKGKEIINKFTNSYCVEREKESNITESGRIDIFIYDKDYSIIIENKITQKAGNQENQLARYLVISRELDKKPVAIIYIPFYYEKPPLYNYSGDYIKDINTINELLVVIPALDPKDGNDLTHGFLDECSKYAKSINNMTAYVCLDQYSKFIKSKGDVNKMAMNEDKKFIQEVLSDKELRKTIEDIVSLWNGRMNTISNIFLDHLVKDFDFKIVKDGNYGKKIDEDIFIFYQPYNFVFGFGSFSGKLDNIKEELRSIFNTKKDKIVFYGEDSFYFSGRLIQNIFVGDFNEIINIFSSIIKDFEEEIKIKLKVSNFT
jgi:hypothetical protein